MDINKKIRKARYRFMEAKPFWSSILGIPYTCDDSAKKNTLALSTDGKRFYLNPDYINRTEIDDLTLGFSHEFLHILLGHTVDKRFKSVTGNRMKFYAANLAADYVVNNIIKEEFGRVLDNMYYDPTFAHMTFEQVFHELYREGNDQIQQRLESGGQSKGNGENGSNPSPSASAEKDVSKEIEDMLSEISEDGDDEHDETEKAKGSGQGKEEQKEATTDEGSSQDKGEEKQNYFESHQHWRGDKKKGSPIEIMLQNTLMSAHLQGMLPAGLEREVEDILHPAIPIRDVISSFVLEKSSSKPNWKRMKKRFYPPIYFPKQDRRDKLHIGIGIDTSGSIDQELLSEFKSSMQYLFSFFKRNLEVVVFQADSKIQGVDIIREPEDMDDIAWRGGGGSLIGSERIIIRQNGEIKEIPIESFKMDDSTDALVIDRQNFKASFKHIKFFTEHNENRPLLEIKTQSGRKIIATQDHSFLILDSSNMELKEIFGADLNVGNRIPVLDNIDIETSDESSWELGFLSGIYLAEGSYQSTNLHIWNTDQNLIKIVEIAALKIGESTSRLTDNRIDKFPHAKNQKITKEGKVEVGINAKKGFFRKFIIKHIGTGYKDKRFPTEFLGYSKEFRKGFIEGFMSGDGSYESSQRISWSSRNRDIREGIGLIMSSFGFPYSKREKIDRRDEAIDYEGVIERCQIIDFISFFDIYDSRKIERAKEYKENRVSERYRKIEIKSEKLNKNKITKGKKEFFNIRKQSRDSGSIGKKTLSKNLEKIESNDKYLEKLKKLAEGDIFLDRIVEIKKIPFRGKVYDISVPGNETFMNSEGIFVHNTDFRPVFDEMRDKYSELKGLIYITDSFGTFPQQEPIFPVVWLIPSRVKQYHNKIPFGKEIFYDGAMCKE